MRIAFALLVSLASVACSSPTGSPRSAAPASGGSGAVSTSGGAAPSTGGMPQIATGGASGANSGTSGACKNLQCQRVACTNGASTTLSGTVYAPNGTLPLYNALVYVPNADLPPEPSGLVCDRCGAVPAGEPIVAALSDTHGHFTLHDVPAGANIPVVLQVGKWRRKIVVPNVPACTETVLSDPQQTRLPRNRSEGDLPRIAVTTGDCDNVICLISKLGIDPAEWGIQGEDKAVTFFAGQPFDFATINFDAHLSRMTPASALWGNWNELSKYDIGVFSCECMEAAGNKGAAAYDAVTRFLAAGGRVFGTDFQYVWYKYSTDAALRGAMQFRPLEMDGNNTLAVNPVSVDTSFPKGQALADWLSFVLPQSTRGQVQCARVYDNLLSAAQPATQVWGTSPHETEDGRGPRFVTINTPAGVPVEQQCGRAVHLDAHITVVESGQVLNYPADCGTRLANGEEVLAFFFFDVASCIQEDTKPPMLPPIQ